MCSTDTSWGEPELGLAGDVFAPFGRVLWTWTSGGRAVRDQCSAITRA